MTKQQLIKEYNRTVVRCRDGRPAISFITWCYNRGFNAFWL